MDLWETALGFMDAQVLLTADDLGVFDALENGPRTAEHVADTVDLPTDSTDRLLVALAALGIVEKNEDGLYTNGPEASEQLVSGKPGYIGSLFDHVRDELYPLWRYFGNALREQAPQWERAFAGDPERREQMHEDPKALRAFMRGMHDISYPPAREFASDSPELEEIDWIVDVGGATGAFLIALAERAPHLRGTVFDLPQVEPIAEEYFREAGLADRLDAQAGDFHNDPIPAGADAYHLGFVLHDWDTETGSMLLGKIAEAAPRGAYLIIGEYFLNDRKTGPLFVARSDLNMLVAAEGRERSAGEYAEWAKEFGFEFERIRLTSEGKNFLVTRKL